MSNKETTIMPNEEKTLNYINNCLTKDDIR